VTVRVLWTPPAERDLRRLAPKAQRRILGAVDRFATTGAGDVRRLAATTPAEYRLRVGRWRVRFNRDGDTVSILRVLSRDKAYR
jgi:mRNA-degrading endonuclease RelE of RelBE toxin-antitoxin system